MHRHRLVIEGGTGRQLDLAGPRVNEEWVVIGGQDAVPESVTGIGIARRQRGADQGPRSGVLRNFAPSFLALIERGRGV